MQNSYASFIAANDALAKCMAKQNVAAYQKMSAQEQGQVCASEAAAVRTMLQNDSVSFRNLLNERIAAVKAQQQ